MGEKRDPTQPNKKPAVNPPTPSQAEGDERTVDKALNNATAAHSTKKDGDKAANPNSGADL